MQRLNSDRCDMNITNWIVKQKCKAISQFCTMGISTHYLYLFAYPSFLWIFTLIFVHKIFVRVYIFIVFFEKVIDVKWNPNKRKEPYSSKQHEKIDSILYVFNALHFTPLLIFKRTLKFNVTKVIKINFQYINTSHPLFRVFPKTRMTIKNCVGSKLFVICNFILETALF